MSINSVNKSLTVNCPSCHIEVIWSNESPMRPFCSERCKMVDLGAWSSEEHVIEGEPSIEAMEAIIDMQEDLDHDAF